ncbi:unnamed protein product [Bubo scandiacus]
MCRRLQRASLPERRCSLSRKKMVDLETSWRLQSLLFLEVAGQWSSSTTPKETRRAPR